MADGGNSERAERFFHEEWLGLVQPSEGLVVSIPVLIDAQCMLRHGPELQQAFLSVCKGGTGDVKPYVADLSELFARVLGLRAELFDEGEALPEELSLYVPEGKQRIAPTLALRKRDGSASAPEEAESTPASRAGARYELLVWDLPQGLSLDKPETLTGPWEATPAVKLDRLLRQCRVPIGLLHNGEALRLIYAPHGESSGSITFRVADMASVGGRPILDALVMLLHGARIFGAQEGRKLRDLLVDSRKRQANVTNDLAGQVFEALAILLDGFEAAAERDGSSVLREALEREGKLGESDHVYAGLLTVLLRLVFILYAEHRSLLPVDNEHYARHMSLLALFEQLQGDAGAFPDSMHQRYGAWGRLLSLFRAIYFGVRHGVGEGALEMPARQGDLFDPERFPFLEGWDAAGALPLSAEDRAALRPPSIDDGTVYGVLEKLLLLGGQRLSYQTLDVEQIGSVYEALMGYRVERLTSPAACLRPSRVWVSVEEAREHVSGARGAKWLQDATGLSKSAAEELARRINAADKDEDLLAVLEGAAVKGTRTAAAGKLVLQPGEERRRTSSHYTPRTLSAPIVKKTLDPLLRAMGDAPSSERLLRLVVCDPAMGSGAFLVEACRYLADQLVAAWTRENVLAKIADAHEDVVNHARRLVAQRCLYGVDKNPYAVSLAKLSLWLVTLAKDEPFTFVDHALRHGDSLVGLSFQQITAFHWSPKEQVETCERELREVLDEAVRLRQRIQALAEDSTAEAQREKRRLLWDAEDALDRVRLIGDLVVGAFFAADKDRAREQERNRRLALVNAWLAEGGPAPAELLQMQADIRARIPVFHWMVELPEVFWADRPDPLEDDHVNHAAFVEAFIGNPPFAGKNGVIQSGGPGYLDWLQMEHQGAHGNADLSAHFFRRADALSGQHGTMGLIATNTIAQGDTRETGLAALERSGWLIYDATESMPWPGAAAVTVSVVHLAKGRARDEDRLPRVLNGKVVQTISSQLRSAVHREAVPLRANEGTAFVGTYVLGMGFTLTPEEREALLRKNPKNAERIFPYLGGQEVNTSPTQSFDRYVISFGQMELSEAERWPDLIAIVREKVKPERDRNNRANYRESWWLFGEYRPGLYASIRAISHCLVTARVSKHLMLSLQPTERILSEQLNVFALDAFTPFAVLQSRVHERWARLLASSMKTDLRYTASDCFENFPFPEPDPRTVIPALETLGEQLYETRARYMQDTDQGLTKTYNALKDPDCDDPRILALRTLHEDLDRAVLTAYGWQDLHPLVPPFCLATDEDKQALTTFESTILDRLFQLNADRAAEEAKTAPAPSPKRSKAGKPPPKSDSGQGSLGF